MDFIFMATLIGSVISTIAVCIVLFVKPDPNNKKRQGRTSQYIVEQYNSLIQRYNQTDELFLIDILNMRRKIVICHDSNANDKLEKIVSNYERVCNTANDYFKRASESLNDNNYGAATYCLTQLDDTLNEMDKIVASINKITPVAFEYHEKYKYQKESKTVKSVLQFFDGCNTKEEADARYRNLAKAFHPDNKGGNETLFRNMQEEYKSLRWDE